MANYTIELRKICDIYGFENVKGWFSSYSPTDYISVAQYRAIQEAFPNWSPENLAVKIINHYYMNEIAFETPQMFRHFAEVKMQEIMEEKLPLLYSKAIEYNPLQNINLTETFTKQKTGTTSMNTQESIEDTSSKEASGTSTSNGSSSGTSLNINNDTPQRTNQQIANIRW